MTIRRRQRQQHWVFTDPIYGGRFELSRCPRKVFADRAMRKWGKQVDRDREPLATACFVIESGGATRTLLWFPLGNRGRSIGEIGVVSHEVVHATLFTLMHRGLNADVDHQEPYAYYLEWLLGECLKRLRGEI